jgi:hypothetical protein
MEERHSKALHPKIVCQLVSPSQIRLETKGFETTSLSMFWGVVHRNIPYNNEQIPRSHPFEPMIFPQNVVILHDFNKPHPHIYEWLYLSLSG